MPMSRESLVHVPPSREAAHVHHARFVGARETPMALGSYLKIASRVSPFYLDIAKGFQKLSIFLQGEASRIDSQCERFYDQFCFSSRNTYRRCSLLCEHYQALKANQCGRHSFL